MKEKKYALTNESIEIGKRKLYRIKALKDFGDVKKGDLGGYVAKERNLSHEGNCWIYNDAKVFDNAWVYDNAKVKDCARVYNYAEVYGNTIISDNAEVLQNATVFNYAEVRNDAKVFGAATVDGNSCVCDKARIYDNGYITGTSIIKGTARLHGNATVYGNAIIDGDSNMSNHVKIAESACISSNDDYLYIHYDKGADITFFRCKDGIIKVICTGFVGTISEYEYFINNDDAVKYKTLNLSLLEYAKQYFGITDEKDEFAVKPKFASVDKVMSLDDYDITISYDLHNPRHWHVKLMSHNCVGRPVDLRNYGILAHRTLISRDIEAINQEDAEKKAVEFVKEYIREHNLPYISFD